MMRAFIFSILKNFKLCLFLLLFIATFWAAGLSIDAYLIKVIINRANLGGSGETVIANLLWPCLIYAGMALSFNILFRVYDFIYYHYFPHMRQMLAETALTRMIDQSHSFYQNTFAGSVSNKINDLVNHFVEALTVIIDVFVGRFLALVFAIITLWSSSHFFGLSMLLWSGFMVSLFALTTKHFVGLADDLSEKGSALTGRQVDVFTNMLSVRLFAAQKFEMTFLKQFINRVVMADKKLHLNFLFLWITYGTSYFAMISFNLYILVTGLSKGEFTPGDFGLVLMMNVFIVDILWQVAKGFGDFSKHAGRITQSLRMINTPYSIVNQENATPLVFQKGALAFKDVDFSYVQGKNLFNTLSLIINPGEKIGLVGYSGGGKTTLVNLILRLYDIQKGQILIDGQNIAEVTQDSLHQTIGMIPQDPSLFHRSLYENIAYGNPNASKEAIIDAAKKAHAHDFIIALEEGYDAMVGERGVKLSGGQRQRIAIARAFLKNAPILILDEATSQMDSLTETYIQESLFKLMENKTTLVIAHRLSTLLQMNRILVFEKGVIVEEGSHETLLQKQGLYKKLWDTQVGGYIRDDEV